MLPLIESSTGWSPSFMHIASVKASHQGTLCTLLTFRENNLVPGPSPQLLQSLPKVSRPRQGASTLPGGRSPCCRRAQRATCTHRRPGRSKSYLGPGAHGEEFKGLTPQASTLVRRCFHRIFTNRINADNPSPCSFILHLAMACPFRADWAHAGIMIGATTQYMRARTKTMVMLVTWSDATAVDINALSAILPATLQAPLMRSSSKPEQPASRSPDAGSRTTARTATSIADKKNRLEPRTASQTASWQVELPVSKQESKQPSQPNAH